MSDSSVESERPGAEEDDFGDLVAPEDEQNVREAAEEDADGDDRPDIVEMLREEREEGTPKETQNGFLRDAGSDSSSLPPAPGNARSPAGSVMSAQVFNLLTFDERPAANVGYRDHYYLLLAAVSSLLWHPDPV